MTKVVTNKFPYTKSGMKKAKVYAKSTGKKVNKKPSKGY